MDESTLIWERDKALVPVISFGGPIQSTRDSELVSQLICTAADSIHFHRSLLPFCCPPCWDREVAAKSKELRETVVNGRDDPLKSLRVGEKVN